jgi:hypothetical protein
MKPGRERLNLVARADWIDAVKAAADAAQENLSTYIRGALNERMRREGRSPARDEGDEARPRGRPKKEK